MEPFFNPSLNEVLWVLGNLLLAYTSVVLLVFIATYAIVFDPRTTTGGKLIFQFMMSLAGVLVLVFIGVYIDPASDTAWMSLPVAVDWWRPGFRFIVYSFVAYSISSLVWLLIRRKWFPHKLKKASDLYLVEPRHTSEIPIVKDLKKK